MFFQLGSGFSGNIIVSFFLLGIIFVFRYLGIFYYFPIVLAYAIAKFPLFSSGDFHSILDGTFVRPLSILLFKRIYV